MTYYIGSSNMAPLIEKVFDGEAQLRVQTRI